MVQVTCSFCFDWFEISDIILDSGIVLDCPTCGRKTIVDLFRPEERAKLYGYRTEPKQPE